MARRHVYGALSSLCVDIVRGNKFMFMILVNQNESGENQGTDMQLQFIKRLVIRERSFFSDKLECSITGIQFAGVHLRELQKSFKNPAANLGLIFEEATKRAIRSVGLGNPPSLSEYVHPNLSSSAALAAKASVPSFSVPCAEYTLQYESRLICSKCGHALNACCFSVFYFLKQSFHHYCRYRCFIDGFCMLLCGGGVYGGVYAIILLSH
jgi:hypothetical protein